MGSFDVTGGRLAYQRHSRTRDLPVAAAVKVRPGYMVGIDTSGNAREARATASDRVLGMTTMGADNTDGSAGAVKVRVDSYEMPRCDNSAGADAISAADIGFDCYVVDGKTVAKTSAGGTRPRAGKILDVTDDGVYVDFEAAPSRKAIVGPLRITDVSAASNSVNGIAPFAGRVIRVFGQLGGAITAADSNVKGQINGVDITGSSFTVAYTGSAAGDYDYAHPTGANQVAAGDVLRGVSDGAGSTTATEDVFFEIEAA